MTAAAQDEKAGFHDRQPGQQRGQRFRNIPGNRALTGSGSAGVVGLAGNTALSIEEDDALAPGRCWRRARGLLAADDLAGPGGIELAGATVRATALAQREDWPAVSACRDSGIVVPVHRQTENLRIKAREGICLRAARVQASRLPAVDDDGLQM